MIVDNIKNSSIYDLVHKRFTEVFACLDTFAKDDKQDKFVLEEGVVWGWKSVISETNPDEKVYEAHRNFIDIHYIVSGEENFGYSNVDRLTTRRAYDEENDYELLDGEINYVTLKKGDFCVVFPDDAHIPVLKKVSKEPLVRVVVKIKLD